MPSRPCMKPLRGVGPPGQKDFLKLSLNKFHLDLSALKFLQGLRVPVRYLVASNFHLSLVGISVPPIPPIPTLRPASLNVSMRR